MDTSAWDIALVCVKAATYAATFGAAGAVFFLRYCDGDIPVLADRRIRRLVVAFVLLGIALSLLRIALLAASMSGTASGMFDPELLNMVWHTGEHRATGIRVVGLLLVGFVVWSKAEPNTLLLIGAASAATSFAWTGHVQALRPIGLSVTWLCVHLLGIAFWVGALAPLLLVARDPDRSHIAAAVRRFASGAVYIVGLILAAGLTLSWRLIGSPTQLWMSAYGRVLALKVALVTLLLGVAAYNRLILSVKVRANDPRAIQALRLSIIFELTFVAAILLCSATLSTVVGPPALE